MKHNRPMSEDLARAFYEVEPAVAGGYEATFGDAPHAVRRACYDRAADTLNVLRGVA